MVRLNLGRRYSFGVAYRFLSSRPEKYPQFVTLKTRKRVPICSGSWQNQKRRWGNPEETPYSRKILPEFQIQHERSNLRFCMGGHRSLYQEPAPSKKVLIPDKTPAGPAVQSSVLHGKEPYTSKKIAKRKQYQYFLGQIRGML